MSNYPEDSTLLQSHDTIGSLPHLVKVLVLYEFGHMGNLVLTFEGGLFSKVTENHLPDSRILVRTP